MSDVKTRSGKKVENGVMCWYGAGALMSLCLLGTYGIEARFVLALGDTAIVLAVIGAALFIRGGRES